MCRVRRDHVLVVQSRAGAGVMQRAEAAITLGLVVAAWALACYLVAW
jgi:hypothetical protein